MSKLILRASDIKAREEAHSHPWNPKSEIRGFMLARGVGLQRTGVSIVRIPPGKESFVYHSHRFEEEWLYILAGRGVAEIDGADYEVGPGDFMGFPTPSVAHHLKNPFESELLYLMGGENREFEVADYPHLGRRMVRHGPRVVIYPLEAGAAFPFPGIEKL
ncbi:MAG TPA: cupin domain-containing protein [Polyangia bacterium]|nr:cupin domain-containing protein [Polyangia bacterium]